MQPFKIDFHVHITALEISNNWQAYAEKDEHFRLLSSSPHNKFVTAEEVIEELDKNGIDKAVVFGFAFQDQSLCRESNNYVLDAVKKFPDRLIGFACISPLRNGMERELERCFEAGMLGVGELFPDGQGFKIDNQKDVFKLSALCQEKNMPILMHVNEPLGHYYPGKTETSLKEAYAFAENNPKLKIIYAHFGGGLCFYELMTEVRKTLSNVYYDTAAGPFLYGTDIYKAIASAGLVHKFIFGSDYPLLPIRRYLEQLDSLQLKQEDLEAILGGNAMAVFKPEI